mmetsp:Transcript_45049/g.111638  ORF Transcript_45049/g.111638 Transcript_45049/m.111638 type:complete len:211 (-) Transcript_45049:76-708(-)|eukprot:CAMPEP_0179951022 /NCGR_PEP_ID=MMETSP0983-20121128/23322_1 /TAXON_ID=483367 /ORGANISM="non described non described, Strain CCMP 2436" /LENGTH=210 /DNA_ID=CAMNT_0021861151 /DNA_START=271 /DNA_END=903 /DNA_ORIENTATION=-
MPSSAGALRADWPPLRKEDSWLLPRPYARAETPCASCAAVANASGTAAAGADPRAVLGPEKGSTRLGRRTSGDFVRGRSSRLTSSAGIGLATGLLFGANGLTTSDGSSGVSVDRMFVGVSAGSSTTDGGDVGGRSDSGFVECSDPRGESMILRPPFFFFALSDGDGGKLGDLSRPIGEAIGLDGRGDGSGSSARLCASRCVSDIADRSWG